MSDNLKRLEAELAKTEAINDRVRDARVRTSQELDALLKSIYDLLPEDVPAFVTRRRDLQDCGEVLSWIKNDRQARSDKLRSELQEAQLKEIRAANDERTGKIEAIMQRLPFLPLASPERADLAAELVALRK
jgi:septal ring factor EnvC (AmiA/AmiB activator)